MAADKIDFGKILANTEVMRNLAQDSTLLKENLIDILKATQQKIGFIQPNDAQSLKLLNQEFAKAQLQIEILTEQKKKEELSVQKLNEQLKKQNEIKNRELDNYQKLSKELNENRKNLKDLLALKEKDTKLTKEQEDSIKKLTQEVKKQDKALKDIDAATGQFQRNVGNYPKVSEQAKKGLGGLSGFLLGVLVSSFTRSREEARQFNAAIERLTNVVGVFAQAIFKSFTDVVFPTFQEWGLRIKSVTELLGGNFSESKKLSKQADELSNRTKSLSDIWSGLTSVISESDNILIERLELQDRLIEQSVLLEAQIVKLQGAEDKLSVIIGDNTSSFNAQEKAIFKVLKVQGDRVSKELELATIQQRIAILSVEQDLTNKQVFKGLSKAQADDIKQKIQTLEIVNNKNLVDKISIENLEALKTATINVFNAENARNTFLATQEKELRQIQQDRFEQQLDILLDAFDNQKTINERIIADDLRVFEERKAVLKRTKELNEQNKKDQEKLFIEQTGLQIDLNDLVNTDDQKLLEKKLFRLGDLSEKERQRLLEVIRDQRTANQDLIDAEKELEQAIKEKDQRILESKKQLKDIEIQFTIEQNERQYDKEEQRQEANIIFKTKKLKEFINLSEQLQFELLENQRKLDIIEANKIVEADERAQKILEINTKFNNDLVKLSIKTNDKIKEVERKRFISFVNAAQEAINTVSKATQEELDKQFQLQKESLEKQNEAREEAIDVQRELAVNGQKNIYGFLLAEQAKAQLEQDRLERKERRAKEIFAAFDAFQQAFIAELKQPGATTLSAAKKAATVPLITVAIKPLISSLIGGSFYDGTEDTGSGGNADSKGGFLAKLHPHERVLPEKENVHLLRMGVMNEDIVPLVMAGIRATSSMPDVSTSIALNPTKNLENKLDVLIDTVKNKAEYRDYTDKQGNFIREEIEGGMKRTIKILRNKARL